MARINSNLVKVLVLYMVLMPFLGTRAEAQGPKRPITAPEPSPLPEPLPPAGPVDSGGTVFSPTSETATIRAFNGFSSDATPGLFEHHGHAHAGGIATFDSPWGEQMKLRYWFTPRGVTFEYDDDLKVRYSYDETGTLDQIVAETPDREELMIVGKRSELAYLGQRDIGSFDMSAYVVIEESLRAKHSQAFLDGLGEFNGTAEVSCTTQGIQCVACLISWAASVPAIAAACVVGGVVTMGAACILAIVAHETLGFSCAATCVEWLQDCFGGGTSGGRIPRGCEP